MPLVAGSVCLSCGVLNGWSAPNCRACLTPLDPEAGKVFTARISHANRGAGTELAIIRGAGQVRIGRNYGEITFPDDKLMSPTHAIFQSDASGFRVVDAGGLNGVYIKIRQAQIRVGDTILCASEVLRLSGITKTHTLSGDGDGTGMLGSPSPEPGSLVLQQVLLGGRTGRTWVRKPPIAIGRADCDVCFPDVEFVSAKHSVIEESAGGLVVRDLDSANGTFIRIRGQAPLSDGDTILIGQQLLRVSVQA